MWSWGTNKHLYHTRDLDLSEHVVCFFMIIGMYAEGLMLILASIAIRSCDGKPLAVWTCRITVVLIGGMAFYVCAAVANSRCSIVLQLLLVLPVGIGRAALVCAGNMMKTVPAQASSPEQTYWRWLFTGAVLNLAGAGVLAGMDNDCTAPSCITELLPWSPQPCRFATASPPGSSCPLPEWFNHAAIMHVLAIASCGCCAVGLRGLFDSGFGDSGKSGSGRMAVSLLAK